jgi:hypothetical protein
MQRLSLILLSPLVLRTAIKSFTVPSRAKQLRFPYCRTCATRPPLSLRLPEKLSHYEKLPHYRAIYCIGNRILSCGRVHAGSVEADIVSGGRRSQHNTDSTDCNSVRLWHLRASREVDYAICYLGEIKYFRVIWKWCGRDRSVRGQDEVGRRRQIWLNHTQIKLTVYASP